MPQVDLTQKFPRLTPVKSPPPMFRINGCGVALYGHRDHDAETDTYVATLCLALVFIPVLCLRPYRVARAQQGWYFVGREPLSGIARGFNALLLGGICLAIGVGQYDAYTSTPAYQARREMSAAHKKADAGHLTEAARIYQTLAVAHADEAQNATAAVISLIDNQCKTAPLSESAGVYAAAAQIARRGDGIAQSDVVEKGRKLVTEKAGADPRAGIEILDVLRPLMIDTRPIDNQRLPLLRVLASREPGNLQYVSALASILEEQGHLDEAGKLLLPMKDKLGTSDGARVLGTILSRQGDYDGAYAVLWPYVKDRLDKLHVAEKDADDTANRLWSQEIQLLKEEKAPSDFYEKYKTAGEDQQRAMVREYVNGRIKNNALYTGTQQALEHESAVVPVAMELGMVMLQRAQGQADPAARKSQLESAEKIFLAISGIAGESDVYRLSLGQVYYWLGKQAEGRKLFNDYLAAKGRAFTDLLQIAVRLRELGAVPEARATAEEAYAKTRDAQEQYRAATFRALCFIDLDDHIAWLKKADTADPDTRASLAKALGDKAFEEGRDQEAGQQYRRAIEAYDAMPRSASSLNESALAYDAFFQATGDRQAMERSADYFQQAVDLNPRDPILLHNAGVTLLTSALGDLIGADIDLRALHETGNFGLLGYLYQDQAGHDAIARRIRQHPGIARARSLLEKVMIVSPKSGSAFSAVFAIHHFTRDEAALIALEARLKAADLDTSDQLTSRKESLSGVKDQEYKTSIAASLKRAEDQENAFRAKGGRTAAIALDHQAAQLLSLDGYTHSADLDKALKLAEEAYRLAPSAAANGTLLYVHLSLAARDLRRADNAFAAYCDKYNRSVNVSSLLTCAAGEHSPFRKAVLGNPHVQKAVEMIRQQARLFPDGGTGHEWALLKSIDPSEAEKMAGVIRTLPRREVARSIATMLGPADADEALEGYWLMQINGRPDEGRKLISNVAAMGIPVPEP